MDAGRQLLHVLERSPAPPPITDYSGAIGLGAQDALLVPERVRRDLGCHVQHVAAHPCRPRALNTPHAALADLLKRAAFAQHRRRQTYEIKRQTVERRVKAPPQVSPRDPKRARHSVARARCVAHAELPQGLVLVGLARGAVRGHA